ncbi:hypothetical protein D3C78_1296890 [compost metagenome]
MRIRVAVIRPFADRQRGDTFGDDRSRHLFDVLEEALEPAFQIHAVPQDQVGMLRLDDIARRRLIIVDFCARFGDRLYHGGVTGHVLGDILNNGKGGYHAQFFFCQCGLAGEAGSQ